MNRFNSGSPRSAHRLICILSASSILGSVLSCGGTDPVRPASDPDCVTPTVTNFSDSTVARVVIRNYEFLPASITIRAGQTVKWKHCGPELDPHTVTSDEGSASTFDLDVAPKQVVTREFATAGSNPYHCTPHPEMQGTVTVIP